MRLQLHEVRHVVVVLVVRAVADAVAVGVRVVEPVPAYAGCQGVSIG